jgi:hypothetical protein
MHWQDNATFLCGHRKSGTTLLLNLFDSHPQMCVFPPDSGFFYGYYPPHEMGDYSDDERKSRVIDVMYGNFRRNLDDLEAWKGRSFPYEKLSERFLARMESVPCDSQTLLLQAICAYRDVTGTPPENQLRRWVEKTTSTEIYASVVFDWFPQAKVIHMVRDPRDNFGSLKSGWAARYRQQNDTIERLLQSMIDRGGLGMKLALLNAERFGPRRYRVIRYEDLTTRPEPMMRELCQFLEIDHDEILLKPTFYGLPWKGNNFDGLKFDAPSAINVGRWRQRISDHEARVIEFHFAESMAQWGYEPAFSRGEQIDAAMEHYKWLNFNQRFAMTTGVDTFQKATA